MGLTPNGYYDVAASWSGCPSVLSGGDICEIDAFSDVSATANFNKVYGQSSNITVTLTGVGTGSVYSSPASGISCPSACSATLNSGLGSTISLYAQPNSGNSFLAWTGCPSPSGNTCQIPAGQNANVTANFTLLYTVTPSAGPNGSFSPSAPQPVDYDAITSFTVAPSIGYGISSVTGCGGTLSGSIYTTGPITGKCTVSASFAALPNTITASAGANGSISPATVYSGNSDTVTITPASGYILTSLTDNGVNVTGDAVWNAAQGDFTYTIADVTSNHTIVATFVVPPAPAPALSTFGSVLLVLGLGTILWRGRKKIRNL